MALTVELLRLPRLRRSGVGPSRLLGDGELLAYKAHLVVLEDDRASG
jgi:hypothetical protein